ncbi:MAG: hypothetical protein O2865_10690 [Planctomycetota bacterium]|nr:hypothetical protein [Planctomycetota bacterium]
MRIHALLLLLPLVACSPAAPEVRSFPAVDKIVSDTAASYDELVVRLTVHAKLEDESRSRVLASTAPEKRNRWSDEEDERALESGQPVILDEGGFLDYTAPVLENGTAIAVVGVTVRGDERAAMEANAKAIADEAAKAILALSPRPF